MENRRASDARPVVYQYSLASMIVRTRRVLAESLGSATGRSLCQKLAGCAIKGWHEPTPWQSAGFETASPDAPPVGLRASL
jgi:hypothetical protein